MNDELALFRDVLITVRDMQAATTSGDGSPWIFTAWFAADEDHSVYFLSKDTRRHSEDLLRDGRIAATFVALRDTLGKPVRSATIEGTCVPVDVALIERARSVFVARFPQVKLEASHLADDAIPDFLWHIRPTRAYLFDELNFPPPEEDPRRVIDLGAGPADGGT